MFKRIIALLLADMLLPCMLLALPGVARADILIEPENDFFDEHQGEMVALGRSFVVADAGQSVAVLEKPGPGRSITLLKNDEEIFLSHSCLFEGAYWGYSPVYNGWVRIDELLVIYDYVSFDEEHRSEFSRHEGDVSKILEEGRFLVWLWPGSGLSPFAIEVSKGSNLRIDCLYHDSEGREWGFMPYFEGVSTFWVCLSDPMDRSIPMTNPQQEPMRWVPDTPHVAIESLSLSEVLPVIILVVAVALATIILIRLLWRPDRQKQERQKGYIS